MSATATDPVKRYLASIGRKGGSSGRGASKRRTTEQCRKAGLARAAKAASRARG